MAATLMDAVRSSQQTNPAGRPSANALSPSPTRRFDDVLASHRAERTEPRPEAREPEAKAKPAARSRHKADDTQTKSDAADAPTDVESNDDATPTDAAESTEGRGPHKTRDGKAAGKTKAGKDADSATDVQDEAGDIVELSEAAVNAGLPQVAVEAAGDEAADADVSSDDKAVAKDGDADGTAVTGVDPNAVVAPVIGIPADATVTKPGEQATDAAAVQATGANAATATKAGTSAKPAAPTAADAGDEQIAIEPHAGPKLKPVGDAEDEAAVATNVAVPTDVTVAKPVEKSIGVDPSADAAAVQPAASNDKHSALSNLLPAADTNKSAAPQRNVVEDNVDRIVTSVRGEMQKGGGTMEIRLDPPSLGQVQVSISIEDGVVSASLQTSNDEATRLLSHSLQQLKTTLESAGVMVDRIQVKQAAPAEQSSSNQNTGQDGDQRQQAGAFGDGSAKQEQQRKEMLQRMWAKVAGNGDPLDLVA